MEEFNPDANIFPQMELFDASKYARKIGQLVLNVFNHEDNYGNEQEPVRNTNEV